MPIDESLRNKLKGLKTHGAAFRNALEHIFVHQPTTSGECRNYFGTILLYASQLYADYVSLSSDLARLDLAQDGTQSISDGEAGALHEGSLRERYTAFLRAIPCWDRLSPNAPFAAITGLRSAADYIEPLALHLPEVYEESIRTEGWAGDITSRATAATVASLLVGLEHMGRNHVLFVLPALQFAADETSWVE